MNNVIAIHQPNFFPWLGYFNKIARADVFFFFDDVQFPKKGGAWSNRVKLLINGEARWTTAAIDRTYSGTREIREMQFLSGNPWREKTIKSLETNYKRHPYFPETMDLIEPLISNTESNIAEYNINAVTIISKRLGMDPQKLKRSSEFVTHSSSNELLCDLTIHAGGNIYMCGGGADGYQDEEVFKQRGLKLQHQAFEHSVYEQYRQPEFVPGLSIIDAAMNQGWERVSQLINTSQ